MSKKYSTTTTLVIVESPAKCKKIEEYLGPGYKCVASFGHVRELSSLKNIDTKNNFALTYTNIESKQKHISALRKEIKNANEIILATDNDREGEGIAWHLIDLFALNIEKTKRIVFHEITEASIQKAIRNPTKLDINLVLAQQTRQIIDLLVGFKVTPILWKFITKHSANSLSAGRCQTPALKIIYENQKDILSIEERKVYNTTGYFTNANVLFDLNKQYESEESMQEFLHGSVDFSHIYSCSQPSKIYKSQPEPLTTSTLQQKASNELHYSPKETMRVCQILYENGYITYMRTDSKTYCNEFVESTKNYIICNYENRYVHPNIDELTTGLKSKNASISHAQEAHEAIRPTNILLSQLPDNMDSKERRMYKLIWENTLESCMSAAEYYSITATIKAFDNAKFTHASELIHFPGWKIVAKKYSVDNKEYQYLQKIKQNEIIYCKKIYAKLTIKGLKQHYTEARLVQLLEENGIGRPSTFSSLVDKIQERGYVKKEDIKGTEITCNDYEMENGEIFEVETKREFGNEKNKLVIQPLGCIIMEFLDTHFSSLFNYEYTSQMETELDKIAKGHQSMVTICNDCNTHTDNLINNLKNETKFEIKIDDNNTYVVGKYGPVIKTLKTINGKEETTFKPIKKDVCVSQIENGCLKIEEIIDKAKDKSPSFIILGQYNNKDVSIRKGKYGLYISWGENSRNLKEFGNRPMESITFEEIIKYLEEGGNVVREISTSLSIRKGPKGDYLFYKDRKMKKPKFFDINSFSRDEKEDYKTCNINILKSWIREKFSI